MITKLFQRYWPLLIGLVVVIAVSIWAQSLGQAWAWFAVTCVSFLLGAVIAGRAVAQHPAPDALDSYLQSDWRHFEMLIELTPEQIAKLQSLTRRPDQKSEALAWLDNNMAVKQGYSHDLLRFFVTSGWASGGNFDHSSDREWNWSMRETET